MRLCGERQGEGARGLRGVCPRCRRQWSVPAASSAIESRSCLLFWGHRTDPAFVATSSSSGNGLVLFGQCLLRCRSRATVSCSAPRGSSNRERASGLEAVRESGRRNCTLEEIRTSPGGGGAVEHLHVGGGRKVRGMVGAGAGGDSATHRPTHSGAGLAQQQNGVGGQFERGIGGLLGVGDLVQCCGQRGLAGRCPGVCGGGLCGVQDGPV